MSLFSVPFNFEVVYSGTPFILNYDNNTNVYYYLSQFPDNNIIIVGKDLNSDPIILTHSEYQSFINRGYNIINPMTVIGNNIYLSPMISKRSIKYDKKKNTKLVTKKLKKWIMKGKFDDVVSHFKVVSSKNKKNNPRFGLFFLFKNPTKTIFIFTKLLSRFFTYWQRVCTAPFKFLSIFLCCKRNF